MIVTSDLTGSVFQQTELPFTFDNAWWVERRLQFMKINGLVKMINGSKTLTPMYIDGYLPKYKWSYRLAEDRLNIDECLWIYDLLQSTGQNFGWGAWKDLVQITDYELFKEAVFVAIRFGAGAAYAVQVYKSRIREIELRMQEVQKHMVADQLPPLHREVSSSAVQSWQSIREMI